MTQYTVSGGTAQQPTNFTANYAAVSLASGDLLVTGGYDTLVSGVSNVGIVLQNIDNQAILSGDDDTIQAGTLTDFTYGDSLVETGNHNTIVDNGFNEGGVTLAGSYNSLTSFTRMETSALVVSGDHNNVYNAYLVANLTVSGSYNTVNVGGGSVTITGNHDTVTVMNATTILATGIGDVIDDNYFRESPIPQNFAASPSGTPAQITITGAGSAVTLNTNNVDVLATGADESVNAAGDLATVVASGSGASIAASAVLGVISVTGANSSVKTVLQPQAASYVASESSAGALAITTVNFSGSGTVGASYSDGAPGPDSAPTAPVSLTLTSGQEAINTLLYSSVTDSVGGNMLTVGGASVVNDIGGNDVVDVIPGTYLVNASLSGAQAPNIVNFAGNDFYNGSSTSFVSTNNVLNLSGNDAALLYAANQDTVNLLGTGNVLILQPNQALPDQSALPTAAGAGSLVNVNGASTALIETSGNSINGANGADLVIAAGNNIVTGQDLDALISGAGNRLVLSGSDTVSSASPYSYITNATPLTAQNQLTVQSGQYALGGLDTLDQVGGTAAISLFGGNQVTLDGANDSVTVGDQIYGGNALTNNGAGNVIDVLDTAYAANTITATAGTLVNMVDNTGTVIGAMNHNEDESLTFIAGSGTANTILGASSNAAITLFGGQSTGDVVYAGQVGGNSLNGGAGGGDLFVGGGTGDVLIGGAQGANTLVAGAGAETLVGAAATDAFSITGGGGADVIQNFAGSLTVAAGLAVVNQTDVAGSLVLTLSDQTTITFAGLTAITQNGTVFS